MPINNEDLSFVVQGPIVKDTCKVIASIKKFYPGSPIILSTWPGEEVESCIDMCSEVVLSDDPGDLGNLYANGSAKNNINRQITSSLNGLKRVKTRYAVKTRTDFLIANNNLINVLGNEIYREFTINSQFRIVKQRIAAVGADRSYPFFCFDFSFAGLKEDLLNLFDIPLMDYQTAQFFTYITEPLKFKYIPEQWIILSFLRKNKKNIPAYYSSYKIANVELYQMSNLNYASNFILTDFDMFGVRPIKKSLQWLLNKNSDKHMYYADWIKMYEYYINNY